MKSKMLFFDIDGTLIECPLGIYEIPQSTKEALHSLQQQGHTVFLATGRCKCFILDAVMKYPFDGYVTCNGAYVEYQGKAVFKEIIPTDILKLTKTYCEQNDIVYYFESIDTIYTLDKTHPRHLQFQLEWGMKEETVVDDFVVSEIETYIGMIVLKDASQIEAMKTLLSPYFDIQQHQNGVSFDLTLKSASKGVGIQALANYLKVPIADTIAFGDGNNDLEMLQTVGLGIAMGNAVAPAKAISNFVTDRVENDGIVKALKHFELL